MVGPVWLEQRPEGGQSRGGDSTRVRLHLQGFLCCADRSYRGEVGILEPQQSTEKRAGVHGTLGTEVLLLHLELRL
jgi:hypothetical protein